MGHALGGRAAEYVMACAPEKSAAQFGEDLVATWREEGERICPTFDPGRSLVERWDYLELCCGPNTPLLDACMKEGLVCGPRIDILLHSTWDIRSGRLIEWVIYLIFSGRIYYIHCGAPCTTFSIARCPKERSKEYPMGKPGCSQKVKEGNVLLFRTLAVLYAILIAGRDPSTRYTVGSHEHPGSAFSCMCSRLLRYSLIRIAVLCLYLTANLVRRIGNIRSSVLFMQHILASSSAFAKGDILMWFFEALLLTLHRSIRRGCVLSLLKPLPMPVELPARTLLTIRIGRLAEGR